MSFRNGRSRLRLVRIKVSLLLCLGAFLLVSAQEKQEWRIIKRLTAQAVGETNSNKNGSNIPILESVFFHDSNTGWVVGDAGLIVTTRDGGQTWTERKIDLSLNLNGVFFLNELNGWAVGNAKGTGVLIRTNDGGKNWRSQNNIEGFELSAFHDIWFVDDRYGWAIGEAQQKGVVQALIIATTNGGDDWSVQYLGEKRSSALHRIKFVDSRHGWVVGHNIILFTQNAGQNWTEQHYVPNQYFFDVDFVNLTEGWVVGSAGLLLHTLDGGRTWRSLDSLPSNYQKVWLASVRFSDSRRGWIAGDEGTVFTTTDSGQTWKLETVGRSEYLRSLAVTKHGVFAVGNTGIIMRRQI